MTSRNALPPPVRIDCLGPVETSAAAAPARPAAPAMRAKRAKVAKGAKGARQRGAVPIAVRQAGAQATRDKAERQRAAIDAAVAAVRPADWCRWAGISRGQLAEQAERYLMPIAGPVIDVKRVAAAMHELLAQIAPIWEPGEDANLIVQKLRADVRVKLADAERKERENLLAKRKLVPVAEHEQTVMGLAHAVVEVCEQAVVRARVDDGDELADRLEAALNAVRERIARGGTGHNEKIQNEP